MTKLSVEESLKIVVGDNNAKRMEQVIEAQRQGILDTLVRTTFYEKGTWQTGMTDDDCHHEMVNFVVSLGKHLKDKVDVLENTAKSSVIMDKMKADDSYGGIIRNLDLTDLHDAFNLPASDATRDGKIDAALRNIHDKINNDYRNIGVKATQEDTIIENVVKGLKTIATNLDDNQIRNYLTNKIVEEVFKQRKKECGPLTVRYHEGHVCADAKKINDFNQVVKDLKAKFDTIDSTAMSFIDRVFNLVDKNNESKYLHDLKTATAADVRLNLSKVSGNSVVTILENEYIPKLASSKRVWYEDIAGGYKSVPTSDPDFLRKLFRCVVLDVNTTVKECDKDIKAIILNIALGVDAKFNIDCQEVLKYRLRMNAKGEDDEDSVSGDLFGDIMDRVWERDEENLYKNEKDSNGTVKKVYYEPNDNTCKGALLNWSNTKDCCEFIAHCILNKPSDLSKCLKHLREEKMFEYAQKELKNLDPKIAEKLLEFFGIHDSEKPEMMFNKIIPTPFGKWKKEILPNLPNKDLRRVIEGNKKLLGYIDGVISFVTANPAILNKDIEKIDTDFDMAKKYAESIKASTHSSSKVYVEIPRNQLFMSAIEGLNCQPHFSEFVVGNFSNNGVMVGGASNIAPRMTSRIANMIGGGGHDDSANHPYVNYIGDNLNNAMKEISDMGYTIPRDEYKQLTDMIDDLKKKEKNLLSLTTTLRLLTDNLKFVKCAGLGNRLPSKQKISLKRLMSNGEIKEYLEQHINLYEDCLRNRVRYINEKSHSFFENIKRILEMCDV